MKTKHLILFVLAIASTALATAQNGYIYIHNRSVSEDQNKTFDYTINKTGFSATGQLNDFTDPANPAMNLDVRDLGGTTSGKIYALAGTSFGGDNQLYMRSPSSSTWATVGSIAAKRIEGGVGDNAIYSNNAGAVFYFNGSGSINQLAPSQAGDVAIDKFGSSNRLFYVDAGTNEIYSKIISGATWVKCSTTQLAYRVAATPTGKVVYVNNAGSANVKIMNANGTGVVDLGKPLVGSAIAINDITVGSDGAIYALDEITGSSAQTVYRYDGGYAAGGTWVVENESRGLLNLTAGPAGQIWGTMDLGGAKKTIWTRAMRNAVGSMATRDWLDDERVRIGTNDNSMMIPVPAGTYTVQQAAAAGWAVTFMRALDPTGNTTVDTATRTATVNVAAGEIVNLVYTNTFLDTSAVNNTCGGPAFFENFGTGDTATYGNPAIGKTSYHFSNSGATQQVQDGYYTIVSSTKQAEGNATGTYGNFFDHTSGNGTGRMLFVNAAYDKGIFYSRRITNLVPGSKYTFSAWMMSVNSTTLKPNVSFTVVNPGTGQQTGKTSTGNIDTAGYWKKYDFEFFVPAGMTSLDLVLSNNNIGGQGNDLAIDDISFSNSTDKGDAPDTYGTLIASGGPCNVASTLLTLGSVIDGEPDGQPGPLANGDDLNTRGGSTNDEDGVSMINELSINLAGPTLLPSYELTTSYFNNTGTNAKIAAWVDFNNNGVFDSGEGKTATVTSSAAASRTVTFTWINQPVTNIGSLANTYARVRIGTTAMTTASAKGSLGIGEVEDYLVPFIFVLAQDDIQLKAKVQNENAILNWTALKDAPAQQYIVERSADGRSFTKIANIASQHKAESADYSFVDAQPLAGSSYYRVMQQLADNKFKVSNVASLSFSGLSQHILFPNPAITNTNLTGLEPGMTVKVVNANGAEVARYQVIANSLVIPVSNLASGLYLVQAYTANGELISTQKLIKK